MTIRCTIKNEEVGSNGKNLRVHRVFFLEGGLHAEDGVIVRSGESKEFTIWNNVRLAIEEEYDVEVTGEAPTVSFVGEASVREADQADDLRGQVPEVRVD